MKKLAFIFLVVMAYVVYAKELGDKVAVVKMMRGTVNVVNVDGQTVIIKKGDWVREGAVVKTGKASFAKLSFIDKSTMNVGPTSEMKIEKFSKDEAGVINVISGKIRSQVTKDYLNMDKDKSKLFIKSRTAVMGVRGTDFTFATNQKTGNSTAVLFEGKIVLNKLNQKDNLRNLENIVNKGRSLVPGQFSIVNPQLSKPTVPAKLSSKQIRTLEKNQNFLGTDNKEKNQHKSKSLAPPGLKGEDVAVDDSGFKKNISDVANVDVTQSSGQATMESRGYVSGDDAKPVDGSIIHLDSGTIVPLGNDSTFDKNSGEWVSNSVGSVDATGEYVPPQGYKITETGDLLKEVNGTYERVDVPVVASLDSTPPLLDMPLISPDRVPGGTPLPTNPPPPDNNLLQNPECTSGTFCAPASTTPTTDRIIIRQKTSTEVEINVK